MDASLRVGTVLDGRYRLERLLGEGGMGTVYRAHHLSMDRPVAVKVLRGHLASDPIAARRFALEAKATTKVDSPHAVKVFDFGITAEGDYFMAMEYLDGRTAQRELDIDGPMAMRRALHVARQALAGLAAAHAVGVIHRDIKPENLLLMRAGADPDFCKVLDFGVAKLMVQAADSGPALTRDGMVFGTPEFMSPEQACGQPLDGRSDLYSLAATLYTLLTGEPLFFGASPIEVLSKHVTAAPPRLIARRGLHHLHALDQVLQRALAKRPADRYRDAAELAGVLAFLAPASEPTSLAGSPTMSTAALPLALSATPESPLGVISAGEVNSPTGASPRFAGPGGAEPGGTGATPLVGFATGDLPFGPSAGISAGVSIASSIDGVVDGALDGVIDGAAANIAMPTGFRPAMTGYLPRVSMEIELDTLLEPEPSPSTRASRERSKGSATRTAARRRWLAMSALAAAVLAAGALGISTLRQGSAQPPGKEPMAKLTPGTDAPGRSTADGGISMEVSGEVPAKGSPDAGAAADAPAQGSPDAGAAADASDGPSPADGAKAGGDDPPGDARPIKPGRNGEADKRKLRELLEAARQARAAGKDFAQLNSARAALELAPRNREALFLLGDAQLRYKDISLGCKTMARLRSNPEAVALAAKAGCQ